MYAIFFAYPYTLNTGPLGARGSSSKMLSLPTINFIFLKDEKLMLLERENKKLIQQLENQNKNVVELQSKVR